MRTLRAGSLILVLTVFVCTTGMADTGIPYVGYITPANVEEASILALPDGSGSSLVHAQHFGGNDADASIVVGLVDLYGYPIPNFPWEDIWLDPETDTASSCIGNNYAYFPADSSTDVNGETTFTMALQGGGWTEGPIWVYLNGDRARYPDWTEHPPVPLRFNSPDINADGLVNLTDVAIFAEDYFGNYHYRSDFFWDGMMHLQDVAKMIVGYGTSCE